MKTGFYAPIEGSTGDVVDVGEYFIPKDLFRSGHAWVTGLSAVIGTNSVQYVSFTNAQAVKQNWKSIHNFSNHTMQITSDGALYAHGSNAYGQLGSGHLFDTFFPDRIGTDNNWYQAVTGPSHTIAIKTDGSLWGWGLNNVGQLGLSNITNQSVPTQVGTNNYWRQVSCGANHTAAIKSDGSLWMWGDNVYGQLGTNTTTGYSSPIQTISSGTNWKSVVCGTNHTVAIKNDGTLWAWGYNLYGGLGMGDTTMRSSPTQVGTDTNWKQIAAKYYNTAAIKTDGTLWSWGRNNYGQLGTSDVVNRSSPVQTTALGYDWKQVDTGGYHTVGVKTDGTLWSWGGGGGGRLGSNNTGNISFPIQRSIWETSGYNVAIVKSVSTGIDASFALIYSEE